MSVTRLKDMTYKMDKHLINYAPLYRDKASFQGRLVSSNKRHIARWQNMQKRITN